MLLTKEHTSHSAVLGSSNAVVELVQMFGNMIGPTFITYVISVYSIPSFFPT
jgi:hypothetical protein